jgi:hypothetical protein
MARYEIEVFVAMNEDGDYEVGIDQNDAVERLDKNVGGEMRRIAKLTVYMAAPTAAKTDVVVPDEDDRDDKVRASAETEDEAV